MPFNQNSHPSSIWLPFVLHIDFIFLWQRGKPSRDSVGASGFDQNYFISKIDWNFSWLLNSRRDIKYPYLATCNDSFEIRIDYHNIKFLLKMYRVYPKMPISWLICVCTLLISKINIANDNSVALIIFSSLFTENRASKVIFNKLKFIITTTEKQQLLRNQAKRIV